MPANFFPDFRARGKAVHAAAWSPEVPEPARPAEPERQPVLPTRVDTPGIGHRPVADKQSSEGPGGKQPLGPPAIDPLAAGDGSVWAITELGRAAQSLAFGATCDVLPVGSLASGIEGFSGLLMAISSPRPASRQGELRSG